jgi:predicted DNA-binding transcriptional regulator AlpA
MATRFEGYAEMWRRQGRDEDAAAMDQAAALYHRKASELEATGASLDILRSRDICAALKITKPTLLRWRHDGTFPEPIVFSRNVGDGSPRSVGWRRSTYEEWLASRESA